MPHLFSHSHEHGGADPASSHHPHRTHTPQSLHAAHRGSGTTQNLAGTRATHHANNPLHPPQYRDALPSGLEAKFHGEPVTGTAIIVDDLPDVLRDESEYELVTPQCTVVLKTFAQMTLSDPTTSVAAESTSNSSVNTPSAAGCDVKRGSYSSHGTASVPCKDRKQHHKHDKKSSAAKDAEERRQKQLEQNPHQVLESGGYIIFSDTYLREHPECKAAAATMMYAGAHPAPKAQPDIDPALPENKKNTEMAELLIEQSEGDYRPLFRKRDSSLVYGRACYEQSDASGTDTCASSSANVTPAPSVR